jgi:hypothetical protein
VQDGTFTPGKRLRIDEASLGIQAAMRQTEAMWWEEQGNITILHCPNSEIRLDEEQKFKLDCEQGNPAGITELIKQIRQPKKT